MSRELQALCFLAGANSIFVGGKLLTTPLPGQDEDSKLFHDLDLRPMASAKTTARRFALEPEITGVAG
jgi:biotin synthase